MNAILLMFVICRGVRQLNHNDQTLAAISSLMFLLVGCSSSITLFGTLVVFVANVEIIQITVVFLILHVPYFIL